MDDSETCIRLFAVIVKAEKERFHACIKTGGLASDNDSCIRHRVIKVTLKASEETGMRAKGGY